MIARLIATKRELDERLDSIRKAGRLIALVPTMGALHEGHGRLIDTAVRETGCVVVSIFVNPIQFNQQSDFERYPRPLEADVAFCAARGAVIVFAPSADEMYPRAQRAFVEVERVSDGLCGAFRPGHFRGVATVVLKLFNIVRPQRAYFGQKDAQQLAVIRRMTEDLNVPVEIVEVPTVRETDGLALSSRNQHLNAEQRAVAVVLHRALQTAAAKIAGGEREPREVVRAASGVFDGLQDARLEYLEIVDPDEMQPVDRIAAPVRIACAAWVGSTRLIDNVLCRPGQV